MVRLNINLDESLKAFIDTQVASGRFRSADDFFEMVVVQERERAEELARAIPLTEEEDRAIQEALDDEEPAVEWTREEMERMKRELIAEHRQRGDGGR